MNYKDFLDIAKKIAKIRPHREINFRTSLNRLYWGIYWLVQDHFKIIIPQENKEKNIGYHKIVKKGIEKETIFGDYKRLEDFRVDADYNKFKTIEKYDYDDASRLTERILSKIVKPKTVPYDDDDLTKYFEKHKKY